MIKLTAEKIDSLRDKLRAAKSVKPPRREYSKAEAVIELLPEIADLQATGYTLDQIAQMFVEDGIPINGSTLKNYKQRSKKTEQKSSQKKRGKQPQSPLPLEPTAHAPVEPASSTPSLSVAA